MYDDRNADNCRILDTRIIRGENESTIWQIRNRQFLSIVDGTIEQRTGDRTSTLGDLNNLVACSRRSINYRLIGVEATVSSR